MCGIVGYIGKKEVAKEVLIDGLEHLEYRGYDSAGVALVCQDGIQIVKELGRISNLKDKLNILSHEEAMIGIGHTRWATHGKPSVDNAHPHRVGKTTIVHNGIIENFEELKQLLIQNGYQFKSETDTEVACAYIDFVYNEEKDMLRTLSRVQKDFRGSYALGVLHDDDLGTLHAMRKDSPLIVGVGADAHYIASDVPAILKYTNKYVDLENNELVQITTDGLSIYNPELELLEKNIVTFEGSLHAAEKNGYETFMLKEIHEQPDVVQKTIHDVCDQNILDKVPDFTSYDQIDIVACGSAYHAGLVGKSLLEKFADIPVNVEIASEYQYKKNFYHGKPLLIVISQSGETADTKKCMEQANERNIDTLAIVNVVGSSIARGAKNVLYTKAGPEIAVATTKAYSAQITLLALIALNIADKKKNVEMKQILQDIKSLPVYMEQVIDRDYQEMARGIYKKEDLYFIGRGVDYALSMEGSLKLKEISYIHSEAYAAGELKHGTISLIDEGTPVISVATDEELFEKTISNTKEVKARGANVLLVTNDPNKLVGDFYDSVVVVPKIHPILQPMLTVLPLQMIAYEVAKLRECDIDKPKNLAKSVTVE